ncbi:spermidine synthase [Dechloromonas sp. A34]|uniref:spermidine synthase n=1 Tax=Dechloromonas sp. A34 TaxID=447588 RepID=UPI0022499B92|nr:hypothetical protein [Dechloromonas sp. A34]
MIDVGLGIILLVVFAGRAKLRLGLATLAACAAGSALVATTFNPQKLVSGVFRTGQASMPGTVLEIAHGRTATISVDRNEQALFIRTNGKPDASALLGATSGYQMDEVTMALLGAIPMALHDAPRRIANIGFGSGMTSATILADPRVQQLDSIEIEPKMIELARHFGELNRATYTDPRSAIHIDDAKSFFASHGQRYDIIVSEPSNPWVSGVAGLFSVEFYRHVTRYLNQDGLFVQWMQMYETHPDRVASVIKALDQSFEDYLVVALNYGDLLLVAKPHGQVVLPADGFSRLAPAVQQILKRLDVGNQADLALRVIGNKALLKPWIDARAVPANSDFAPYLDTHADYDRFIGKGWPAAPQLALSSFPMAEILGRRPAFPTGELPSVTGHFGNEPRVLAARLLKTNLVGNDSGSANLPLPPDLPDAFMQHGLQVLSDCRQPPQGDKPYALAGIAVKILPYLAPADALAVLAAAGNLPCFQDLPASQALWPVLLEHVANRDAAGFGAVAEQLLDQGQGITEARAQYLFGMAVLGRLGEGNPGAANSIRMKHQSILTGKPVNLGLEILLAYVASVASGTSRPSAKLPVPDVR